MYDTFFDAGCLAHDVMILFFLLAVLLLSLLLFCWFHRSCPLYKFRKRREKQRMLNRGNSSSTIPLVMPQTQQQDQPSPPSAPTYKEPSELYR
jgi:hypothetical protein